MRYFPVFLDLKGKLCVVVGGGRVADRKVRTLLKAGALVKVIGPELIPSLRLLRGKGKITHVSRSYRRGDLQKAFLAIAATDDRVTNAQVFRQSLARQILVNVVDDPTHSYFIVPSIVEQGDLLLAISTSGQSPALARWLRQKLQREIGPEYAFLLSLLGAIRKKILPRGLGPGKNQKIFRKLVREDLFALIRRKEWPQLERRLKNILGSGFSLRELGIKR